MSSAAVWRPHPHVPGLRDASKIILEHSGSMTRITTTHRACFLLSWLNVPPNREVHRAAQLRDFVRKVIWGTLQYPIVSQLVHGRTTTQRDQETTFSFVWKWKYQHSNVFCLLFPASGVKLLISLRVKILTICHKIFGSLEISTPTPKSRTQPQIYRSTLQIPRPSTVSSHLQIGMHTNP